MLRREEILVYLRNREKKIGELLKIGKFGAHQGYIYHIFVIFLSKLLFLLFSIMEMATNVLRISDKSVYIWRKTKCIGLDW